MIISIPSLTLATKIKYLIGTFVVLGAVLVGYFISVHNAEAAIVDATVAYDFESDTPGEYANDVNSNTDTIVVDDPVLGQSLSTAHVSDSEEPGAAIVNFSNFPYDSEEYQQVSWRHSYTNANNTSGFILRAQDSGLALPEAYSYNVRIGYLFQVSIPTDEVNVYKMVAGEPDELLDSYSLAAQGINSVRWYRATADGDTLTFEWSSDGTAWTALGSTTDDTYATGGVQFIDGFGGMSGAQVIDDVSYTYKEFVAELPGAPTGLTASRYGSGRAYLSWTSPSNDGGSAVYSRFIEYKQTSSGTWLTMPEGQIENYGGNQVSVGGLTNGVSYDFRVSAINSVGTGPASASASVSPATFPGAPTSLTGVAGNAQVALSWTAPSNNGSAITDYYVYYRQTSSGGGWSYFSDGTSTSASATVTGLTNGASYDFSVQALNSLGTSQSSNTAVSTPGAAPGVPTALTSTRGNAQVALSWTAPTNTGGFAVTDYKVEYKTSAGSTWNIFADGTSTGTTATVTSLTNGTGYDFRVSATNSIGTGSVSAISSATPAAAPGTPSAFTATAGNTQTSLAWTAPANNGSALTDYKVEYKASADSSWSVFADGTSTGTTATVTGLSNGVSYDFRVSAINAIGTGTLTSTATAIPATLPGIPSSLVATPGDATTTLVWTAPSGNGSAITDYKVEYKNTADSTWLVLSDGVSTAPTVTITSLSNGTSYDFRVSAINGVGTGIATQSVSTTPAAVPDAPVLNLVTPDVTTALLSWEAPSANGSSITDYKVEYRLSSETAWVVFDDGISTNVSTTVASLAPNTSYDFRIAALNTIGEGAFSNFVSTTTESVPVTVTYDNSDVAGSVINKRPTFSGTANPNSTVTVTVHSDPISCTTNADADGAWTCTLPSDLPSGEHTVYVSVIPFGGGAATELGPYAVSVVGAENPGNGETGGVVITPGTPNTGLGSVNPGLFIALIALGLGLLVVAFVQIRSHLKERA